MPIKNWCLPQEQVDKFKEDLISGELDPFKLAELSSIDRTKILSKYVGDANAKEVNTLFESKLLLENQQRAMKAWAKSVIGPKSKDPVIQDTLIKKIDGLGRALTPATEDAFLSDLVAQKMGMSVTYEEVKKIADLAEKVKIAKEAMQGGQRRTKLGEQPTPTEEAYGLAAGDLREYVQELGLEANKVRLEDFKHNPLTSQAPWRAAGKLVYRGSGATVSIITSLDASYLFRQGHKTLINNPDIWKRNALQSFKDMVTAFGSHEVMRQVNADIVSRPTYPQMLRAKLPLGIHEEAFPESIQEKIPVLGRFFRASEHAFTAFNQRNRADTFDKLLQISQKSGVDIDNTEELKSIGRLAASMTSRGYLGKNLEKSAELANRLFFSPRNWAASLETFTMPFTGAGGSNFVRKQATKVLAMQIAAWMATMLAAYALGIDREINPLSADFGKVKYKNRGIARALLTVALDMVGFSTQTYGGMTRVDTTGGVGSLVTLANRMARWKTKSSTTGKIMPLNSGKYGSLTVGDVLDRYAEGKLKPVAGLFRDLELRGEDYKGNKPTFLGETKQLFEPLVFSNLEEIIADQKNPHPPKVKR